MINPELLFHDFEFKGIDPSFILKFERLERLKFDHCVGFSSKHCETFIQGENSSQRINDMV